MEMLAFVVATLVFGGLVVAAIGLGATAQAQPTAAPPTTRIRSASPAPARAPESLDAMTVADLQELAKSKGLTGVSKLRKAELIAKLRSA
jgi:hypothetical protein